MPELRKDPIIGRWVIISTERGKRPSDWQLERQDRIGGFCPFCPGNEDKTPPEILALRPNHSEPNTSGWSIRVVPNKFPALQIEGDLNRRGDGLYDLMNGVGAHEVIIETPEHEREFADYEAAHIENILKVFRDRIVDLRNDERFKYILVFKNHGRAAGASLEHSHSQLIATPILPKRVVEELQGASKHYQLKERCIFCDLIYQEMDANKRIISQSQDYLAIAPFASRFPYEAWILPKKHYSHYERMEDRQYGKLAYILKDVLQRINRTLDAPPFNFILHSTPIQQPDAVDYHWHIEVIPKLTKIAGFEWGAGFYINPVPPEDAAFELQEDNP
ncbi:MAG: galactose-1-phosphate uridylyltransferase [Calditrichaeota bacterium]|nr:MAG: galactose-1-phosphate uridylyltransferase [Calditrichota bacterium]